MPDELPFCRGARKGQQRRPGQEYVPVLKNGGRLGHDPTTLGQVPPHARNVERFPQI